MMNSKIFLLAVLLVSSVSVGADLSFEVQSTVVKNPQSPFTVVYFRGAFFDGTGDAIVEKMREATTPRIIVELNSTGGRVGESDKVIRAMDDLRAQGKRVDTFVANGSTCQSACTIVYMNGTRRLAGDTASFMFHAPAKEGFPGLRDGFYAQLMIHSYIEKGLSEKWIREREKQGVFSAVNDYYISAKEAYNQRIGLVTELAGPIVEHEPMPFDPQIRPR